MTLSYQQKVHKDKFHKINMFQSNHLLSKIEDFQFSKIMNHKDTLIMIKDQSNSLLLTWNKTHLINKDMMSHMNQFKHHNTHKMSSQLQDMIKNKIMITYHCHQDHKTLSIKEDQSLQLKDLYIKVNKTTNKHKKINHLERIKLVKSISQELQWDKNRRLWERHQTMSLNINLKDQQLMLINRSKSHYLFLR